MTYYTIYRVTNKISGKIYIGSHKTQNLEDGYMGSGKYLRRAYKKLGLSNFTKEILYIFDNPSDMYKKEAELVNEDFLSEENTYNLKVGGFGGWDYVNSDSFDHPAQNSAHAKMMYQMGFDKRVAGYKEKFSNTEWLEEFKKQNTERQLKQYKEGRINGFKGKEHSRDTKSKISSSWQNREEITCPHCDKSSKNKSNMLRWHFDKCKQR